MLGVARISERTLVRWAAQCRRYGIAGCIDGHWLRRSGGRYSMTGQLREAVYAVHAECLHTVAGLDEDQGEADPPVRPETVRPPGAGPVL